MDGYKTVKQAAEAVFCDRHSEFISAVIPVSTEEEAISFIESRKKLHPTARHTVYAYIIRDGNTVRYSDDGEPHSTAGVPTLDVLKKSGLCNVCAVTTRYFGGILLGTGGLVRAYTEAVKQAVEKAGTAVMGECVFFSAMVEYNDHSKLLSLLSGINADISDTVYEEKIKVYFSVPKAECDELYKKTDDVFCGKLKFTVEKTAYGVINR